MPSALDPMTLANRAIERSLISAARQDADFRALLLRDPRAALVALLGVDPIPSYTIRVVEEQPGEVVLVLPRDVSLDELPDDLLDGVVGGTSPLGDGRWGQIDAQIDEMVRNQLSEFRRRSGL
ncbi:MULTISPECIES: hypothetical protein [Azorhizobium]|nr:hypothetical protein [Azorhizobium sp. AG788]TDT89536.1 putative ribosomally synthesized peptide [Azorhizobium sp. AG788]